MTESQLNNKLLVTDGVVLMYSGHEAAVHVPSRLDKQLIRTIGKGAFFGLDTLRSVTIDHGITHIGTQAFSECLHLKQVRMPATIRTLGASVFSPCPGLEDICIEEITFSPLEWAAFSASCITCQGGARISNIPPQQPLVNLVVSNLSIEPACLLPPSLPAIFRIPLNDDVSAYTLSMPHQVTGIAASGGGCSELQAVMSLISSGVQPWRNQAAEEENDRLIRKGFALWGETCLLFTADRAVTNADASVTADLHILIGEFFWPSVTPVICDQKTYYVYHRMYASHTPAKGYSRQDVALLDENGLIIDQNLSRRVYEKYILPAIL